MHKVGFFVDGLTYDQRRAHSSAATSFLASDALKCKGLAIMGCHSMRSNYRNGS